MIYGPHPDLAAQLARSHGAELLERAERYRAASLAIGRRPSPVRFCFGRLRRRRRSVAPAEDVTLELRIRYAGADDADDLRRLATLDGTTVPPPPLLVAERDGELQAALSLWDGRAIADPFRRTEALVELLVLRAAHIHSAAAGLLKVRRSVPRWAPASPPSKHTP
jgi:hypothetical protein